MQSKRDELVISLPPYHLVVKPAQDRITFFAYNATHQLSLVLAKEQLSNSKWFDQQWFDNPMDFYRHIKLHPHCLGIDNDNNELVLTAKIGQKEKPVGITMNVTKLEGLKQIRIAQKKLCFQLRQEQQLTQQCQQRIAEKEVKVEWLRGEYTEQSKLKQKAIRELLKSRKKTVDANRRFNEMGGELEELSVFYDLLHSKLALQQAPQ